MFMGCKCFVTGITKEALDCINRGEYQKAIKLLHGNETENEGVALYLLGLAYDGLQDLKSAFTYYKRLRIWITPTPATIWLSRTHMVEG